MNIIQVLQSILVYISTVGLVTALTYAVALSKRVTILEQKMDFADKGHSEISSQIKEILKVVNDINSRIYKLEARIEHN